MATSTCRALTKIGLNLFIVIGCARMAHGQSGGSLPTCSGWSNCNPGRSVCTGANRRSYEGPTVVSDFADGVSSDGRGPYVKGTDGVQWSIVVGNAGLSLRADEDSIKKPRTFTVNLNNPVPGGGGIPLGIFTSGNDDHLYAAWKRVGNAIPSLHDLPVGDTVPAAQMNVSVHIDGRFHILQMGPLPLGNCHTDANRVNGAGTSSGTIYRESQTKWVIDLPAGSVGRLFDLHNTTEYAVDKGLYYLRLHYEIGEEAERVSHIAPRQQTQTTSAFEGTWREHEVLVTRRDGSVITVRPEASLYVVSRTHYSMMATFGVPPRPLFKTLNPTDSEKVVAYNTFWGHTGKYEIVRWRPRLLQNRRSPGAPGT